MILCGLVAFVFVVGVISVVEHIGNHYEEAKVYYPTATPTVTPTPTSTPTGGPPLAQPPSPTMGVDPAALQTLLPTVGPQSPSYQNPSTSTPTPTPTAGPSYYVDGYQFGEAILNDGIDTFGEPGPGQSPLSAIPEYGAYAEFIASMAWFSRELGKQQHYPGNYTPVIYPTGSPSATASATATPTITGTPTPWNPTQTATPR